jgi:hypothetical protein
LHPALSRPGRLTQQVQAMPKNIEIPLHLCQVLEEEFESLHGTSNDPRDDTFTLRDEDGGEFPVTVREDWLFREGHVSAHKLAAALAEAKAAWERAQQSSPPGPPSAAALQGEPDLSAYLAFRYPELLDGSRADYPELLNQVLLEPNNSKQSTFRKLRFERLALNKETRKETRALMDVGWGGEEIEFRAGPGASKQGASGGGAVQSPPPPPEPWSDLVLFRRLLLEGAFREHIRRVYGLRLERIVRKIHDLPTKQAALCFSGGGIRSGTFALGVVQSLARHDLLGHFDYLSTVSGGGYIGGWLTAWIHRHRDGLDGVVKDLKGEARASKLEPEPEPLSHLRDYSNFITPRTGMLSADTWTFVGIYVRNLLLNWVVLLPLLASVLMIPRVANAVVLAKPDWLMLAELLALGSIGLILLRRDWKGPLAVLALALVAYLTGTFGWLSTPKQSDELFVEDALLVAGTLLGGYVLAYMRLNRPSNSGVIKPGSFWDRHRDQESFIWLCMLPLALSGVLLTTFWAWFRHTVGPSSAKVVKCGGFAWWSVTESRCHELPVLGAAWNFIASFLYARFGAHYDPGTTLNVGEFGAFLLYGLALGFIGWLLYIVLALLSWVPRPRWVGYQQFKLAAWELLGGVGRLPGVFKDALGELIITVSASGLGSVLLYVAAVKIPPFYNPVIEPSGFTRYKGQTVMELLDYSKWNSAEIYTCLAFPVYLLVFFLGITLFVGLTSRRSDKPPSQWRRRRRGEIVGLYARLKDWAFSPFDRFFVEDEDREWLARASAWVFIVLCGWTFLGGLVIFGPLLYIWLGAWLAGAGGASGLASLLGGKSARTPGNKKSEGKQGWLATLGVNLIVVAAFVFFACIVIAISLLTGTIVAWLATYFGDFPQWLKGLAAFLGYGEVHFADYSGRYPFGSYANVFGVLHFPSWRYLLLLALGLHLFGRGFAHLVNLNKFSLHAGYRDRIIRAFLGASRPAGERRENPFTGFDPRDNLNMEELRPWLLRESDFKGPGSLTSFVNELNRPAAERSTVAAFLREHIEQMNGDSRKYFKDSPGSIEINASFRSALFADLNNILQSVDLPAGGAAILSPPIPSTPSGQADDDAAGRPTRVRKNRLRLTAAFPGLINYPPRPYRLLHVVNMALNLVGGERLAWQQRRAESFTSTSLHSGSLFVGYRRTRYYGGKNGITLGTAVATSGAAASSNMGYFSPSVFVTFVLTFFNARLGWWLGNPGVYGADTFYLSHPKNALSPIIDEAFGLTDDKNPYVLLSDGGHFENLGLYEMVLRRCGCIFVVDGSADPEGVYDDLGGAVRKIRIDFGIRVEFRQSFRIFPRPKSLKKRGVYCAVGDIHYEDVDDPRGEHEQTDPVTGRKTNGLTGKLIYIKPAVYGDEPRDIFNYAKGHPDFPHESTADQFFDEPQFESHRMLGFHILEQLIGGLPISSPPLSSPPAPQDLCRLVEQIEELAAEKSAAVGGVERRAEGGAGV